MPSGLVNSRVLPSFTGYVAGWGVGAGGVEHAPRANASTVAKQMVGHRMITSFAYRRRSLRLVQLYPACDIAVSGLDQFLGGPVDHVDQCNDIPAAAW